MGLRETFQKAAQVAMKATGNVSIPVIYRSISDNPSYNPATGTVTEFQIAYKVNMLFDLNMSEDIKNIALDHNEKLGYIAVADLEPTPKTDDRIEIDYVDWTVTDVMTDPADALWILKIKRK
jgi:hypothetical protein